jgi:hypothetical protein
LQRIYVRARDGKLVELSNVVNVQEGSGPSVINRLDRQRAVTIFASLEKKPLGQAKDELDEIAERILPPDYLPKYQGMADTMKESFGYLLFALMLGIIMAYMILAAQFESFVHPITVLLSMPLSFIGAFGALFITGKTINIYQCFTGKRDVPSRSNIACRACPDEADINDNFCHDFRYASCGYWRRRRSGNTRADGHCGYRGTAYFFDPYINGCASGLRHI